MVAADTNVVVRLLTADDPDQTRRAAALFAGESVFLAKSVLLETEWVLRHCYGLERTAVLRALTLLPGLPGVTVEAASDVAAALAAFGRGLDFADALHLAASRPAGRFATFDEKLVRRAPEAMPGMVVAGL
ncbi:MAG: hypothetical protein A2045_08010 [Rhodocyclales bacterium GWA2_65_20]|nr:MAG: hypothetical protein A2045_08010 [Rhodocyclales bacterium GWA2_65_20]